jgi:hypothetical protein
MRASANARPDIQTKPIKDEQRSSMANTAIAVMLARRFLPPIHDIYDVVRGRGDERMI